MYVLHMDMCTYVLYMYYMWNTHTGATNGGEKAKRASQAAPHQLSGADVLPLNAALASAHTVLHLCTSKASKLSK